MKHPPRFISGWRDTNWISVKKAGKDKQAKGRISKFLKVGKYFQTLQYSLSYMCMNDLFLRFLTQTRSYRGHFWERRMVKGKDPSSTTHGWHYWFDTPRHYPRQSSVQWMAPTKPDKRNTTIHVVLCFHTFTYFLYLFHLALDTARPLHSLETRTSPVL